MWRRNETWPSATSAASSGSWAPHFHETLREYDDGNDTRSNSGVAAGCSCGRTKKTAQKIDGHAEFRAGLERHSKLSSDQAQRLESGLDSLGEDTSTLKTITGQISAFVQTLSGYLVGDEPVKAVLATSTFAQMKATSYRILIAAATTGGLNEVVSVCERHLAEELRFADWLEQQSEIVTQEYLRAETTQV